ncbi:MAG TPA: hypothetical protein VHZ76_06375 [Gammaproteobacteria bacterium]|jgi:hypothetical protein|nr:hypothetical protein [Gammaproteobacteria bacterium]
MRTTKTIHEIPIGEIIELEKGHYIKRINSKEAWLVKGWDTPTRAFEHVTCEVRVGGFQLTTNLSYEYTSLSQKNISQFSGDINAFNMQSRLPEQLTINSEKIKIGAEQKKAGSEQDKPSPHVQLALHNQPSVSQAFIEMCLKIEKSPLYLVNGADFTEDDLLHSAAKQQPIPKNGKTVVIYPCEINHEQCKLYRLRAMMRVIKSITPVWLNPNDDPLVIAVNKRNGKANVHREEDVMKSNFNNPLKGWEVDDYLLKMDPLLSVEKEPEQQMRPPSLVRAS